MESDLWKEKNGVTEHLRRLNPCMDIRMPTSAIFAYVSYAAGTSMLDVACHCDVNFARTVKVLKINWRERA